MDCTTPWIIRGCWMRPGIRYSARPEPGADLFAFGDLPARRSAALTSLWRHHPPAPAELQAHTQPPVLIRRQRIPWNALTLGNPPPLAHEAQHHYPRQRDAVTTQPYPLPATGTAERLPATRITAQASHGIGMSQKDTAGNHPTGMGEAANQCTSCQPPGQLD